MPANSSQHSVAYIAESTFGATPATPTMSAIRSTSCSLNPAKDVFVSEEMRDDRNISDMRHGALKPAGDIAGEFMYDQAMHDILEAVLCSTWTEAGSVGTIDDTLSNGVKRRSVSIERLFADVDGTGTDLYALFKGCEFNTFSLSVQPNAIVTYTLGVMAREAATATAAAGTRSAPSSAQPFDSFTGSISEGGSPVSIVTGVTLNIDNGMEARPVVGDNKTLQHKIGRANITGEVTLYLEDWTQADKFINETESSLAFTLSDGTNAYDFSLPRILYSGAQPPAQGESDVILTMPFQALYDSVSGSTITITR